MLGELATRLPARADVFAGTAASRGVNYVTAHDGFTLADLVAFTATHNAANGEDNRDGAADNFSWNHGVEGPTDDPAMRPAAPPISAPCWPPCCSPAARRCCRWATRLGRSQGGNNNAYAQDNALSWFDWDGHGHARWSPSPAGWSAPGWRIRRCGPAGCG